MGTHTALVVKNQKSAAQGVFDASKGMMNELMPQQLNPLNYMLWDKESNNPTGAGFRAMVPTVYQPIQDVKDNINFMGYRIHPEPVAQKDRIPQTTLAKRDVSPAAQAFTNWLLTIGGGDPRIKDLYRVDGTKIRGVFDVNPSDLEYLGAAYTGGVGKFVLDVYKTVASKVETGEWDLTKAPLVSRLVKPYNEEKIFRGKFYELKDKIETIEFSLNAREKAMITPQGLYSPAKEEFITLISSPRLGWMYRAKARQAEVEALQGAIDQAQGNEELTKQLKGQCE
jgi:hypothetical protein